MLLRRALFLTLAVMLVATGVARADTAITALAAPTPVRAWAGTAVLSVYDAPSSTYRLAIQRGSGAPVPLPGIAPSPKPFDADIGPGPGGAATIVYIRCGSAGGRCHPFRTTPQGGRETEITGAASTGGSESAPTVWGRTLAFARSYAGRKASAVAYVRPLDAGVGTRSVRVPAVPARECEGLGACRAITDGTVPELELRGTKLAEVVHFGLEQEGICGAAQVRLVDTRTGSDRRIRDTVCGLSGQTLLGLSQTSTLLLFAMSCPGDPGGCQDAGALAYRYSLRTHALEHALRPDVLLGFAAVDADQALEVRAPETNDGRCDNFAGARPVCPLVLAAPLPFTPGR